MGKWLFVSFVSLAILPGCNGQKDSAGAAFAQVQASVAPVSPDLEKYSQQEYAQLSSLMDEMKRQLNAKDYAAALVLQPQVMKQLTAASGVAAMRKNELARQESVEWKELAASVPILVLQLSDRLGELQDLDDRLPAGVSSARLREVNAALPEINAEWSATLSAANSRNLPAAIDKARALKKRCIELSARLGLKLS